MRILMVTNAYPPLGGGVARAVRTFAQAYRDLGEEVLVVAPETTGRPDAEDGVLRVPSIEWPFEHPIAFGLPVPGLLTRRVDAFRPEIIHSHHPFWLGDTAVRLASTRGVPLVFTYHTRYAEHVHYMLKGDGSPLLERFVARLAAEYTKLCDQVFAPTSSTRDLLVERGVAVPIAVVPTGVDVRRFARGTGAGLRRRLGIPAEALVVGHVGRLALEKNLGFLARAVAQALQNRPDVHALFVGQGRSEAKIRRTFERRGLGRRVHMPGRLSGSDLVGAYHAMDLFAFASKTETQGLVLAEAMAAGLPVVALQAPGSRDIVRDGENGYLVRDDDKVAFAGAISRLLEQPRSARRALGDAAVRTAEGRGTALCAQRALRLYDQLIARSAAGSPVETGRWNWVGRRLQAEVDLWSAGAEAASDAFDTLF